METIYLSVYEGGDNGIYHNFINLKTFTIEMKGKKIEDISQKFNLINQFLNEKGRDVMIYFNENKEKTITNVNIYNKNYPKFKLDFRQNND